jgi:methyl coenzyme M reductase subunit C-like uncharacterized protein (methanogenesis marker protein 7)
MTDLTNKVDKLIKEDVNSIQAIVNKFSDVLKKTKPEREIPYLAYVINVCVNYINENHKDLSADWKAWAVIIVRNQYLKGKLKNDDDIPKTIDGFLTFWDKEYKKYCEDIIAVTEYDRDRGFVFKYEKKIGS